MLQSHTNKSDLNSLQDLVGRLCYSQSYKDYFVILSIFDGIYVDRFRVKYYLVKANDIVEAQNERYQSLVQLMNNGEIGVWTLIS